MKTLFSSIFWGMLALLILASCSETAKDYYNYRVNAGYTGNSPMPPLHTAFSGTVSAGKNVFSPDPLVNARWENISDSDKLEIYELYPVTATTDTPDSFKNLQSLVAKEPSVKVVGAGDIMVDFGVESAAWLEFDSPDLSGEIEMSISEYNEPGIVNCCVDFPVKTAKPVKYGNTYRLELNKELHEGVRFGWIHVRQFDRPFTITRVRKVAQTKPVNYNGSFECDNDMLNRIWYTGAYSVRVNMLYDYISPILMDRGDRYSWAGDAHLIQAAALVAFGNYPHVRQNLLLNSDKAQGINSYDLLWIKSAIDYYYHTGEINLFREHSTLIAEKLDYANAVLNNCDKNGIPIAGNLFYIGWDERLGAGFEYSSNPKNVLNYRFVWFETLRMAVEAFRVAGENGLAEKYETIMNEQFAQFTRKNPAFLDNLDIHAAAQAINTGLLTNEQEQRLFDKYYPNRLHRVSFSPFNGYFILESMARRGEYAKALETIDDCWGSMVRYGGTTYFEVFHPSWADVFATNGAVANCQSGYTSLCHPWGSGVTRWITDEILGIKPITPAYREALIKPNPVNLSRLKGSVPTPAGIISADFDFEKGNAVISIPENSTVMFGYPKRGQEIVSIKENDEIVWQKGGLADDTHVYINSVEVGSHSYTVEVAGRFVPSAEAAPISYAITAGQPEALSWDEGYAKYGTDGVVLFHPEEDIKVLPPYINSVVACANNKNLPWDVPRVLSGKTVTYKNAAGDMVSTELGLFITRNPDACYQTFTVDVSKKKDGDYLLTLYVADADDADERREGFELFDLNTFELLSPFRVVDDFKAGKFISYRIDRDVRLRLYHIRGDQAVLSALLFSK